MSSSIQISMFAFDMSYKFYAACFSWHYSLHLTGSASDQHKQDTCSYPVEAFIFHFVLCLFVFCHLYFCI